MKVSEAWNLGYRGDGVTIGIVDDGVEVNHPDLAANIVCYTYTHVVHCYHIPLLCEQHFVFVSYFYVLCLCISGQNEQL